MISRKNVTLEFYLQKTRTVQHHSPKFAVYHLQISSESMTFCVFPSTPIQTVDFPSPAAPRPKAPKRIHVPPRVEETHNKCNWRTSGFSLPKYQNVPKSRGENSERSKHTTTLKTATLNNLELSDFWFFFQNLNGQTSRVGMARSTSRKEATAKMRFKGQVTGDVNLFDQTMTSKSKPKIPDSLI